MAFIETNDKIEGSVAKNLAPLQDQKKPSQFRKLIIFIRKKMTHKGENYSVKMQKDCFCNGTSFPSESCSGEMLTMR